jgi:hypothetical protein
MVSTLLTPVSLQQTKKKKTKKKTTTTTTTTWSDQRLDFVYLCFSSAPTIQKQRDRPVLDAAPSSRVNRHTVK